MVKYIALLAGSLVGALLLLSSVELVLRVFGVAEGPQTADPFAGFSTRIPIFEATERADGTAIHRVAAARLVSAGGDGPEREFLAEKPSDGFRVFVVGGSTTAGFPYPPRYAFAASLSRRLEAALPDVPIEVVNSGLAGYGSRRVLIITREIARYEPDLLIVYSGHNEWAEQRFHQELIEMDPRWFRLRELLLTTRLAKLVARVSAGVAADSPDDRVHATKALLAEQSQMFRVLGRRSEGHGYATPEEVATRDGLYRKNVREMVRVGRDAGAAVLLMTLTQNFADWEPGASGHDASLGKSDQRRWYALMQKGHQARGQGDCRAAIAVWAEALEIDGQFAELHYHVAACHRALGELDLARLHYRLASDLDWVPHGAPTHYNETLRELAEQEGALLFDADAALVNASVDGLLGAEFFNEFVHPNLHAHQILGGALAEALRVAGIPRKAFAWKSNVAPEPAPSVLYAENPELEIREHRSWRVVCMVAQRERCVEEQTRALARLGIEVPPLPVLPRSRD